ncbi:hypothetical protein [Asanoa siamensis]|nr:hypothetical protein [Asanoa siamensis]
MPEIPMTATELVAAINELCSEYARASVARALSQHAGDAEEHAHHLRHAEHWLGKANTRWTEVVASVEATVVDTVDIEAFRPVRPLPNGQVEIHACDHNARPLVMRFTGAEAFAVGAHLTAYAAIGLDRAGQRVESGLPHLPATTPTLHPASASTDSTNPTSRADPPPHTPHTP